jgi:hypothetical protein
VDLAVWLCVRLTHSLPQRHLPPFHFEHFFSRQPFFLSCLIDVLLGCVCSWAPRGWAIGRRGDLPANRILMNPIEQVTQWSGVREAVTADCDIGHTPSA